MLAKACALVLEDYPIVNARYEPGQTVYQKDINVAMAVAIDGGLITPTLKVRVFFFFLCIFSLHFFLHVVFVSPHRVVLLIVILGRRLSQAQLLL